MKRKYICINSLPVVIWLLLFLCGLILKDFEVGDYAGNFIGMTYIFMIFAVPLFYAVYNFCAAHEINMMLKLYAVSLLGQSIGLVSNGILYYCFISSDPETFLIVRLYLLITLIFTAAIDLAAI
ncbi:MAG: hypothetical protein J1F64_07805, partial [Oscillospiraceae bacterium]|nr:hypothetical protein [Oscillospiraceae bacterium]